MMNPVGAWRPSERVRRLDPLRQPPGLLAWCEHIEAEAEQRLAALRAAQHHDQTLWIVGEAEQRIRAYAFGERSRLARVIAHPMHRLGSGSIVLARATREWGTICAFADGACETVSAVTSAQSDLDTVRREGGDVAGLTERLCQALGLDSGRLSDSRNLASARVLARKIRFALRVVRAMLAARVADAASGTDVDGISVEEWQRLWTVEYMLFGRMSIDTPGAIREIARQSRLDLDAATRAVDPLNPGVTATRVLLDRIRNGNSDGMNPADFRGYDLEGRTLARYLLRKYTDWDFHDAVVDSPQPSASGLTPDESSTEGHWYIHPVRSSWALDAVAEGQRLMFLVRGVQSHARVWETVVPESGPAKVAILPLSDATEEVRFTDLLPFVTELQGTGWYRIVDDHSGKIDIVWRNRDFGLGRLRYAAVVRPAPPDAGLSHGTLRLYVTDLKHAGDRELMYEGSALSFGDLELRRVTDHRGKQAPTLVHDGNAELAAAAAQLQLDLARAGLSVGLAPTGRGFVRDRGAEHHGLLFAEPNGWSPVTGRPEPPWFTDLRDRSAELIVAACRKVCEAVARVGGRVEVVHEHMFSYFPDVDLGSGDTTVFARLLFAPLAVSTPAATVPASQPVRYPRLGYFGLLPSLEQHAYCNAVAEAAFALFAAEFLCPPELLAPQNARRSWKELCATIDGALDPADGTGFAIYAHILLSQRWMSLEDPDRYYWTAVGEPASSDETGVGPDFADEEAAEEVPSELLTFAAAVHRTGEERITVRELLTMFGARRRGARVIKRVSAAIHRVGIAASQPLWLAGLDDPILFQPR